MFCGRSECQEDGVGLAERVPTEMADTGSLSMTSRRLGKSAFWRSVVRWVWAIAFFAGGARFLVPTAYHWWAAGFPPREAAQWHEAWGNIFFAVVFGLWAIGALGVWFMRPHRTSSTHAEPPSS